MWGKGVVPADSFETSEKFYLLRKKVGLKFSFNSSFVALERLSSYLVELYRSFPMWVLQCSSLGDLFVNGVNLWGNFDTSSQGGSNQITVRGKT